MEKADGKSDTCGLHIEKDISELARHMVCWDYEEALEKFLKRRSKNEDGLHLQKRLHSC